MFSRGLPTRTVHPAWPVPTLRVVHLVNPIPAPAWPAASELESELLRRRIDPGLVRRASLLDEVWREVWIVAPLQPDWKEAVPGLSLAVSARHAVRNRRLYLTLSELRPPWYMNDPKTQPMGALGSETAKSTCSRRTSLAKVFRLTGFLFSMADAITYHDYQ